MWLAFAPVNDLPPLSKTSFTNRALLSGKKSSAAIAGGQILGGEYSDYAAKNQSGTILRESTLLKSDQWQGESHRIENGVRGAINFRQIPVAEIYALGQPAIGAIDEVARRVHEAHPTASEAVWITLQEEPIVYINGAQFCLRRQNDSLRNTKDCGGISASRLGILEERLRD